MTRERSLLDVCIARGGYLKGIRVATFIVQWAITSVALGREPTLGEYWEWWRENERTAYRQQAAFREVFEGIFPTPQPLVVVLDARRPGWIQHGVSGFARLPASLAAA